MTMMMAAAVVMMMMTTTEQTRDIEEILRRSPLPNGGGLFCFLL
jgi:hypothetical protein